MKTKQILYFILCVAGTILPYSQFIPFLREHGLDTSLFVRQLFANNVSGFLDSTLLCLHWCSGPLFTRRVRG